MAQARRWKHEVLHEIYTNPSDPGAFRTAAALYKRAQALGHKEITRAQVVKFLAGQNAHTMHRQARRRYRRVPIYAHHIHQQWQADLADMNKELEWNDGVRYILVVVDTLSKYAAAQPCARKEAKHVTEAFQAILERLAPAVPQRLQTDDGKEFYNAQFKALCAKHGINHFSSGSDQKAAGAERFNRTLKDLLSKYMRDKGSLRWLDVLQPFVNSYNATVHSRTGITPNAAVKLEGEEVSRLFVRLYGVNANKGPPQGRANPQLQVGQMVRISRVKGIFDKGYSGQWTAEHFIISEALQRYPRHVYKLIDIKKRPIRGLFYPEDLQPIEANRYIVEEVVREKKGPGGRKQLLVKWLGWAPEYNTWVPESDLEVLRPAGANA